MKPVHALAVAASCCAATPVLSQEAPPRLQGTGLYADGAPLRVRSEHLAFTPQYGLWSDGASKRRWLSLPPNTFIDGSDPDAWQFPAGTRLWKEFSQGGRRMETRYIERLADGSWRFAAYVWNETGTEALLAPAAGATVYADKTPGGRYVVPGELDCRACHEGARVPVLGFSALQLSPDRDPQAPHAENATAVNLRTLTARGLIRNLPASLIESPPRIAASSASERAALGYLHANCGHCHSGTAAAPPVDLMLTQLVSQPTAIQRALRSMLGATSTFVPAGFAEGAPVVAPGRAAQSVLAARMRSRDPYEQMPPLGTQVVDAAGLAVVERWINSLPSPKELHP